MGDADDINDRLAGVILGGAVGDAIGLPFEGLSRRRAARMLPGPLRHRFLLGHGMCSDDTEHACMTARALLAHPNDVDAFARSLAWRLRGWLLALPAGVGLATARAILKLWVGFPPSRSGVRSAGNGPAMRAAVIGAFFREDRERLRAYVRASTRLTHTDPRAERGALLVALAAAHAVRHGSADGFIAVARGEAKSASDEELGGLLDLLARHLIDGATPEAYADALGLPRGVSGYVYHTTPVALFCWLRAPHDYSRAVESVIRLGGDTDSTAAIVGALVGATAGAGSIPRAWIDGLFEFPRSVPWMRELSARLANPATGPLALNWLLLLPRNLLFLVVVLLHGLRRLIPR